LTKITELKKRGLYEDFFQICQSHGILVKEIFSRRRATRIVEARRECIFFLRAKRWSYPEIGLLFDRDHTTIMGYTKEKTRRSKDQRVSTSFLLN